MKYETNLSNSEFNYKKRTLLLLIISFLQNYYYQNYLTTCNKHLALLVQN